jgi:hypothetical protein
MLSRPSQNGGPINHRVKLKQLFCPVPLCEGFHPGSESQSPEGRTKAGGLRKDRVDVASGKSEARGAGEAARAHAQGRRGGGVVAGLAWALADVVQVVLGDFDLTLYKVCIPVALHRICLAHLAVPSFKPSLASRKGCGPGGARRD